MLRFYFYMIFTLTSAFACINEAFAQVASKNQSDLSVSVKTKDASARDANDGYILLNITGGEAPYTIDLYSTTLGFKKIENKNELELKDLNPGAYLFFIQDKSYKLIQKSITISQF